MNIKELQAIVNPIYITAKGLLNLLIAGGDPDALKLVPHMIPEDLKKKVEKRPPPEMVTCFKIGHMARSDIFNTVALKCGKQTIIDLPCGYSTRCFKVADNGQKYFGFDLPIVIVSYWLSTLTGVGLTVLVSSNVNVTTGLDSTSLTVSLGLT